MHWFLDPIFKQFADFEGSATRQQYGMFVLLSIPFSILVTVISTITKVGELLLVFQLAILIPSLAIAVRRLHDLDRSGWWLIAMFVPLVNLGLVLYLLIVKGGTTADAGVTEETMSDIPQQDSTDSAPVPEEETPQQ